MKLLGLEGIALLTAFLISVTTARAQGTSPTAGGQPYKPVAFERDNAPTMVTYDTTRQDRRAARRPRAPYGISLSGFVDYSKQFDPCFEGIEAGPGFELELSIPTGMNNGIRIGVARLASDLEDPSFAHGLVRSMWDSVVQADASSNVWRFDISFQRYGWPKWNQGGKYWWYLTAGGGLLDYSYSGHVRRINIVDSTRYDGPYDAHEIAFFFSGRAGAVTMLTGSIGIDTAIEFDLTFYATSISDPGDETLYGSGDVFPNDMGAIPSVKIGLVYVLGNR